MSARRRLLTVVVLLGAAAAVTAGAFAASGDWGTAIEVPGAEGLNLASAEVTSVSCVSAGNCAAGGYYNEPYTSIRAHVFVVEEKDGVWGQANVLPTGGHTYLNVISCAKASFCAAGGSYTGHHGNAQAFVVNERNGVWGKPTKVPGTERLNHRDAYLYTISCPKPGFCGGGGLYTDSSGREQAFVVNERHGVWHKAIEVPGSAALNVGPVVGWTHQVSCSRADSCAAAGSYSDKDGSQRAFVVTEKRGVWGKAIEVPGTAAPSHLSVWLNAISCARPGACTAGGSYYDALSGQQAFVVNETNGVWHKAIDVPGWAALNIGTNPHGDGAVSSISCARVGSCAASGSYTDGSNDLQAFVVNETNGIWGNAIAVPGLASLNVGGYADASSISCATASSCGASGIYSDGAGELTFQAFVVSETNGIWGNAVELPGSAALNVGSDATTAGIRVAGISCATAGSCAAGGFYTDGSGRHQAFVTSP